MANVAWNCGKRFTAELLRLGYASAATIEEKRERLAAEKDGLAKRDSRESDVTRFPLRASRYPLPPSRQRKGDELSTGRFRRPSGRVADPSLERLPRTVRAGG